MSPYLAKGLYKGKAAVQYEAIRTTSSAARRKFVVEAIVRSLPAHSRVLDVPCGTGRFHPLLAKP
jgi:ubiquinone/menaquinone biosynthesis C-methylase UbiE